MNKSLLNHGVIKSIFCKKCNIQFFHVGHSFSDMCIPCLTKERDIQLTKKKICKNK